LKIGQKLAIPSKKSNVQMAKAISSDSAIPKSTGSQVTHLVKVGDSPISIAKRYGVSVQALMQSNKITDPKKIRVNQKLVIPLAKLTAPVVVPAPTLSTPAVSSQSQDLKPAVSDEPLGYVKEVNNV